MLRHPGEEKITDENKTVFLKKIDNGYQLYRNGKPFYIKGASGNSYLKELADIGGNTIRVYDTLNLMNILNEAQKNNLAVVVDIYIPGFQPLNNPYSINENNLLLKENVTKFVKKYKSHPAVLFWNLGNELNYPSVFLKHHIIPNIDDLINIFNIIRERNSFIRTFNELIDIIHLEDPNHPVSTSISTHAFWKRILSIHLNSPNLDMIGYNIFAPPVKIRPQLTRLSFFIKFMPFYISEWGTEGPWAQEKTAWGTPIETTSTNKGEQYREKHRFFMKHFSQLLGSIVFYWGQKQERTHTWFNIFDGQGRKSQVYYELKNIWKDDSNHFNLPPQLKYMLVNNKGARDNLVFKPNEFVYANVLLETEIDSTLQFNWEVHEEDWNYLGVDIVPKSTNRFSMRFENKDGSNVSFQTPEEEGPYRIFVFVYDKYGNFATANTPFYVLNNK